MYVVADGASRFALGIDSGATSDFMSHMFSDRKGLAEHTEALRRTQIDFRNDPPADQPHYAHPAFWAPFALVGLGSGVEQAQP